VSDPFVIEKLTKWKEYADKKFNGQRLHEFSLELDYADVQNILSTVALRDRQLIECSAAKVNTENECMVLRGQLKAAIRALKECAKEPPPCGICKDALNAMEEK
jgi:hypothetical protein